MVDNEAKQEELNRLHRLLFEKDEEFQRARLKRGVLTIIGFAVFYFVAFYLLLRWSLLEALVITPIFAVIHVLLSSPVFYALFTKSRAEDEFLEEVRKKINDIQDR